MTEEDKAWYHCGRCGSLFKSPPGDPDERVCALCGRDPALGPEAESARNEPPARPAPAPVAQPAWADERRSRRFWRPNVTVAKLVSGWVVLMLVLVIAVRLLSPEDSKPGSSEAWRNTTLKGTTGDETVVHLDQAMPGCQQAIHGFLDATSSEERNQFVMDPVTTAGRMARFYALNPSARIDPQVLKNTAKTLLKLPAGPAVEARWESPDGIVLDCVFVRQADAWLLDWDHFVRYNEFPWGPFLAGEGPEECEFRLLVRRRLARDGSGSNQLSLVFHPPRFGRPESITEPSVEVMIQNDTETGKRLLAGFKQRESHTALFGATLPDLDPEGFLRVRVKLRRVAAPETDKGKEFQLVDVIACHWLTIDAPGVTPAESGK
ncbi:MAG: hypothetical protein RLZZ522_1683 [Verrucomicrobiota bacterium]